MKTRFTVAPKMALVVKNKTKQKLPVNAGRCKRLGLDPYIGKIAWRRAWQPTPAFLPGESHGQRSLVGYSPWGHKELNRTEVTLHALKDGGTERKSLIPKDTGCHSTRISETTLVGFSLIHNNSIYFTFYFKNTSYSWLKISSLTFLSITVILIPLVPLSFSCIQGDYLKPLLCHVFTFLLGLFYSYSVSFT